MGPINDRQLGLAKRTQSCATDGAETKLGDSLIKSRTLKRTTKQSAASFGSGRTCNDRHTLSAAIVPTGAGVASPVHGVNFAAFIGIRVLTLACRGLPFKAPLGHLPRDVISMMPYDLSSR
ncbi:hypothetical protein MCOR31_006411 [Pyricularia oryzae]|nr:hypothetical protein MCOR31_006411 [Pyricularia oryzae]